jgi:hypothetical protein
MTPNRDDRIYEEALALWRSVTDEPPPLCDAQSLLDAAIQRAGVEDYDRLQSEWLEDPALSWAVYREASPRHA